MRISEEIIEKVKEQNDIVDVVSDVVRLKRAGRNFSGLCPFHNEKVHLLVFLLTNKYLSASDVGKLEM